MSQPPQPRPWFRLASLARPNTAPPPPPPSAPAPRPTFIRPTLTQTFAPPPPTPSSPQPSIQAPPQRSIQTPPQSTRPSVTAPPSPATPKTPPPATKPSNPSPKPSPAPMAQSPKPQISAPSSPMPTRQFSPTPSPSKAAPPPPPSPINAAGVLTPSPQIPKYNEQKSPSPKTKPLTPPPSPLTLPPPQLVNSDHEKEQKIVMVHDNRLEKDKHIPTTDHYNNHHHTSPTGTHAKKEKANYNNTPHKKDSEDIGMSVITLAGENKGAVMELTPNSQYPRNGHFTGNRHLKVGNNDKSWSDGEKVVSDSEGKKKHKDKNKSTKTSPFHAYTNSNVQGVNNSIMYNCSCTHNDPGVHLSVTRKPKDPIHPHHV